MKVKNQPYSKKLLALDYIIAIALIIGYIACVVINGAYSSYFVNQAIQNGYDITMLTVPTLLATDGFSAFLSIWIAQLGVSSTAYYVLVKSEHKMELPMELINDLPDEIKEQVDMTTLITTVLSTSE